MSAGSVGRLSANTFSGEAALWTRPNASITGYARAGAWCLVIQGPLAGVNSVMAWWLVLVDGRIGWVMNDCIQSPEVTAATPRGRVGVAP